MATLLELFTEVDFELIFEAIESRKKHYEHRIKQQTVDAAYGSVKQQMTLEKYIEKFDRLNNIQSIISTEAC